MGQQRPQPSLAPDPSHASMRLADLRVVLLAVARVSLVRYRYPRPPDHPVPSVYPRRASRASQAKWTDSRLLAFGSWTMTHSPLTSPIG
jgi:hypothetical protein